MLKMTAKRKCLERLLEIEKERERLLAEEASLMNLMMGMRASAPTTVSKESPPAPTAIVAPLAKGAVPPHYLHAGRGRPPKGLVSLERACAEVIAVGSRMTVSDVVRALGHRDTPRTRRKVGKALWQAAHRADLRVQASFLPGKKRGEATAYTRLPG